MNKYALLINPGHNRVYYKSSQQLSELEFEISAKSMECIPSEIKGEFIAGIYYLTFESEKELSESDLIVISRLSFVFALFKVEETKGNILRPVEIPNTKLTDENLSGILKYTGKTNELFTRMMINVAVSSCGCIENGKVQLLDPIAGKGTTLFEGVTMGYDCFGIEIGDKAVNESFHYFKKYLETEKFKHEASIIKQSGENKSFTAKRYSIELAKLKSDFKNNKQIHWEMISGNSVYADKYFKKNSFDVIVGDLPYGVQHGNVTNEKQTSITRSPKDLVKICLPAWKNVLKKNGVIVLAWNTFVFSKKEFSEIFEKEGFEILSEGAYSKFEHRVDSSIKRDIIVAKKV